MSLSELLPEEIVIEPLVMPEPNVPSAERVDVDKLIRLISRRRIEIDTSIALGERRQAASAEITAARRQVKRLREDTEKGLDTDASRAATRLGAALDELEIREKNFEQISSDHAAAAKRAAGAARLVDLIRRSFQRHRIQLQCLEMLSA